LEKNGAGLFLHNSRHIGNEKKGSPAGENKKEKKANYTCSCLDEFLTPFTEAELPLYSSLGIVIPTYTITYKKDILSNTSVYSLLRGPPALS